jgi:pimeloyl-ACP methyl ester carboxylesterase
MGRELFLQTAGDGGPAVVFLPGAGLVGLDYLNVHERAAELTTSVLYDRGGTGWSKPVPLPRSAADVAAELRDLLRDAAVPGPYVLAGHSIGAVYARRFAQLFPADVAGLLLIDPGHEDLFAYLPEEAAALNEQMKPSSPLPDLTAEQIDAARTAYAKLYATWPEADRAKLIEYHLTAWRTVLDETANLESEVYDELRAGGPVPDVPLIVLTATGRNPYWANFASEDLMRRAMDGLRALHAAIAGSVTHGEHRLVEGVSHQFLHIERPDAVVDGIRDLIREAAKPARPATAGGGAA